MRRDVVENPLRRGLALALGGKDLQEGKQIVRFRRAIQVQQFSRGQLAGQLWKIASLCRENQKQTACY